MYKRTGASVNVDGVSHDAEGSARGTYLCKEREGGAGEEKVGKRGKERMMERGNII
jgi:hypothetical protein